MAKKKVKQFMVTFYGVKSEAVEKSYTVEAEDKESAMEKAEEMLNWDSSIDLEDSKVEEV